MIIDVDKVTQEVLSFSKIGSVGNNPIKINDEQLPVDFIEVFQARKFVFNGAVVLLNEDFKPPRPQPETEYVTKEEFEKQRKELLAAQEAIAEIYESSLG